MTAVDEVARLVLGPHDRRSDALASEVARLSDIYTRGRGALREQSAALAARLRFFVPRDLPKIEGPLSELAWAGAAPSRAGKTIRVLDLGAGLGTSTLGAATWAARLGVDAPSHLEVVAVERDARSLDVFRALAARAGRGALEGVALPIELRAVEADLESPLSVGSGFDLVLVGLALNELYVGSDDRIERRARFLEALAPRLAEDGAIVVIEPALRESSRDLQRVREALVARTGLEVFAPCTHAGPCPLLSRERDWCHEDLPLALPPAIASVARAAGLRYEGLTYAYLTLRRAPGRVAEGWRVVGGPLRTKGKREWELCGEGGGTRAMLVDREAQQAGDAPGGRGSLVALEAVEGEALGARVRLGRAARARALRVIG